MSDSHVDSIGPIDYADLRSQVEQRLKPRLQLLRRRWWLIVHILVFLTVMAYIHGGDHANRQWFYYSISTTVPATSYIDPAGISVPIPEYTYENWYAYGLVSLLSLVWFVTLLAHTAHTWMAFGRERLIQRAMDREIEMEKLRLQVEFARLTGSPSNASPLPREEKRKRVTRLSDDGELLYDLPSANPKSSNNNRA